MRFGFSFVALALLLISAGATQSQIRIGTVRGTVTDPNGAVVRGAQVTLDNRLTGFRNNSMTGEEGTYTFNEVPFGSYSVTVKLAGFEQTTRAVNVASNIPAVIDVSLSIVLTNASVDVQADNPLVSADSSSTQTVIDETFIQRLPKRGQQLQDVIATTAGWRTENDGLLHIRGVDDGTLFIFDGVPVVDRLDKVFGSAYDAEEIRSLNVITGNVPAEFGGRSGAVVTVQSKSMIGQPLTGGLSLSGGSFSTVQLDANLGGTLNKKIGFFVSGGGNRSQRFLDPVDPGNFNNRGGVLRLNTRVDWQPTTNDLILFDVFTNGTDLHIPNDLEQELAGQRQRLELRSNNESFRWQHTWSAKTVTDLAYYRQSYGAKLIGSAFDTPLFANQDRTDIRQGIVGSITHLIDRHTLKAGFEVNSVSLNETFQFAVTDIAAAMERQISEAALQFGVNNPFVFAGYERRTQFSGYVQDSFRIGKNLTVDAGVRYDRSNLLVRDQQLSPRVGVAYYIARTKTALRASFNRLYMPPQIENLLLASSEQARMLSPFATPSSGGSAQISPEKTSAYEVGFSQDVLKFARFDAAYWYRSFRNYDDPNVFFNTPIIFPNSVAKGFARGVDVRIDVPERNHWSGYLSYGNARVLQTGPINGGLFLTDDFIKLGPGVRFIPDQDERNTASFAITYDLKKRGVWASLSGRYESGVPLEVDPEALDELRTEPGADLVNFERERVRPWSVFNISTGWEAIRRDRIDMRFEFSVQNIANKSFVYNFGNPFSGTHFGYPRLWSGGVRLVFH
jgi:hypothetical protein